MTQPVYILGSGIARISECVTPAVHPESFTPRGDRAHVHSFALGQTQSSRLVKTAEDLRSTLAATSDMQFEAKQPWRCPLRSCHRRPVGRRAPSGPVGRWTIATHGATKSGWTLGKGNMICRPLQ